MNRGGDFSTVYKRDHFVDNAASECYLVRILVSAVLSSPTFAMFAPHKFFPSSQI